MQSIQKFLTFYGTLRLITVIITACNWILFWAEEIHSTSLHPISLTMSLHLLRSSGTTVRQKCCMYFSYVPFILHTLCTSSSLWKYFLPPDVSSFNSQKLSAHSNFLKLLSLMLETKLHVSTNQFWVSWSLSYYKSDGQPKYVELNGTKNSPRTLNLATFLGLYELSYYNSLLNSGFKTWRYELVTLCVEQQYIKFLVKLAKPLHMLNAQYRDDTVSMIDTCHAQW